MLYLLDTGILLRFLHGSDPAQPAIRGAIRRLRRRGDDCVTSLQNLCEFWNVCTRPASARGGMGLDFDQTYRRLRIVERLFDILPDSAEVLGQWRALVLQHRVHGVQVHDARLVALMNVHGVTHLLTLNPRDFGRFPH